MVTGQNYYTAITRARFGVKLWTERTDRLIDKLERYSGVKTSALEGLGRLDKDSIKGRAFRHGQRWDGLREQQQADRQSRKARSDAERDRRSQADPDGVAAALAGRAQSVAQILDRWLTSLLSKADDPHRQMDGRDAAQQPDAKTSSSSHNPGRGHDR